MLITTHGKYISDNQSIKPRRNYMWIVTALETWDCKSNNILKANSKTEQRYRADNTTYDLLEKLTELRRATIHIVIVCYSEKKKSRLKSVEGGGTYSSVLETLGMRFLLSSPSGVKRTCWLLSQKWCVATHMEYCQPEKFIWALVSRDFIGGYHIGTNDRPLICPKSSTPPEVKLLLYGPKPSQ